MDSNNRVRIDFDVNAQELQEITKAINILDRFNKQSSKVVESLGTLGSSMGKASRGAKEQADQYINLDRAMNAWANRLRNNQSTMSSYEAAQAKLTDKLKQYGRDVKVAVDESGKLAASFKNAEGNVVSMTGKYDAATNSIKSMKTTLSTASMEVQKKAEADKKAAQEMDRLHAAALKTNRELDNQKKRYEELTRGTDLSRVLRTNGGSLDVMNNAIKVNSTVVRASIDRNGKFSQTLRMQDGTLRTISGYYDQVNRKLVQYSDSVSRAESGTRRATGSLSNFQNGLSNLERSMQGLNRYTLTWADAVEIAGTRMLQWNIAGTVIFGLQRGLKDIVKTLIEIDTQMTQLVRVLPETTNFNEMISDSIRLSTELGRSLTDINEGLITFARSGFNNVDTRFLTEAATLMANVSDLSVSDGAETLTSAITLFNIKARDSIQVVNKLNEVDNDYAISTQQLATSIARAGGTAAAFGVDLNELIGHTTSIGVATRESGAIIGNSLKTIYSRINTLPAAQKAIEGLGIATKTLAGDNRDVADIMNDLAKKWPELSNAQKQNLGVTIAGRYQLSRFLAMLNNYQMGLDAAKTAQHSYNSAVNENEKYMKSIQASINLVKSSWEQFAMALGKAGMYDAIKTTLEAINNLTQGFTVLVGVMGKWSFAVPAAAAAVGIFALQFSRTKQEMLAFQMAMLGMNSNMSRMAFSMSASVGTGAILATTFNTLKVAAIGLTTALLTNPLTWITIALTAIPMLIGHFQRLKQEQEALYKKAEDNTKAFKDFKKEIENKNVNQTSLDVFTAKADVARKTLEELKKTQATTNDLNSQLTSSQNAMASAYDNTSISMMQTWNWQDQLSKKTKDELADIGIKYDKYKSIEELMKAVQGRQKEYSDTVKIGNDVLKESQKQLMFNADAFDEVGDSVKDTMDQMELFFGVNDKMIQQMIGSYNAIMVLTKIKEKDGAQTEALDQAYQVWEARLGVSREELMKHPELMKENISWQQKMSDKWGETTQKVLSGEQQRRLASDITTQKVKENAQEQVNADKKAAQERAAAEAKAAKERAAAAEKEAQRKAAAWDQTRSNMALNAALNTGVTVKEVANATLRGNSSVEASKRGVMALQNEGKQMGFAEKTITTFKNIQNSANQSRQSFQTKSGQAISNSLSNEKKQAASTAKGHSDAATKVSNAAKTQKDNVIKSAGIQNKEHKRLSDDETKSVTSGWDNLKSKISSIMDWIKGLFGGGSNSSSSSKNTVSSIKGYAKGTSSGGHSGGPAIVGELGPELAYIPNHGTTIVGKNGPELLNLPKGTSVLPNKHTEKILKSYGFPAYAGGVGNFFDAITKGPKAVWEAGVSKFGLSDSIIPKWFIEKSGSAVKYLSSLAVDKIDSMIQSALQSFGNFAGQGAEMAKAAIIAALRITGQPMSWVAPMMTIAQHESGFNPSARNDWDINAKNGDPSVGLFQIIGSTFRSYMMPGMGDRTNPLHSAVAAIRYMLSRYGGVWGHPGIISMAHGGGYKPYANGGLIKRPHYGLVGEAGPEAIIPLSSQKRSRAMELYEQVGRQLGVRAYANGGIVGQTYTVKWGDSLGKIAAQFKTTVKNLMSLNKSIKDANKIYAGQKITVSKVANTRSSSSKSTYVMSKDPNYGVTKYTGDYNSRSSNVNYLQQIGAYSDSYATTAMIKYARPYAKTAEDKRSYNSSIVSGLGNMNDVKAMLNKLKDAKLFLPKPYLDSVRKELTKLVQSNAIEKLNTQTSTWLDSFNKKAKEATDSVKAMVDASAAVKDRKIQEAHDNAVNSSVSKTLSDLGISDGMTETERMQKKADELRSLIQKRAEESANLEYRLRNKGNAERLKQLDGYRKEITNKMKGVEASLRGQGITDKGTISKAQEELAKRLAEINTEYNDLQYAMKNGNQTIADNKAEMGKLAEEYKNLQAQLDTSTAAKKIDEFGNIVRNLAGVQVSGAIAAFTGTTTTNTTPTSDTSSNSKAGNPTVTAAVEGIANQQKVYNVGVPEGNKTFIVQTGVAVGTQSELKEFAMIIKKMMDEENGRSQS